jgi:hypothetical protein
MNTHIIRTPCHDVPFMFTMRFEGPAYLQYEVVESLFCTAPGCYNEWDAQGDPV